MLLEGRLVYDQGPYVLYRSRTLQLEGGFMGHGPGTRMTLAASRLLARRTQPVVRSRGVTPRRCGLLLPLP